MKTVFLYENYRNLLKDRFASAPRNGYGQARRLAETLNVHTTLVSQILSGVKSFTLEQAAATAEYLGLTDLEARYFLLLVQRDRAGTQQLKKIFDTQLKALRSQAFELINRLSSSDSGLSEEKRAQFYSDWTYSAIRQIVAIPEHDTSLAVSRALDLPTRKVNEILEFLVGLNLCTQAKGKLRVGPKMTHLEADSPWVLSHHRNWRLKALNDLSAAAPSALHYTAPMTLSKADALRIRELIVKFLESVDKIVEPSPSEELHCLSVDWFNVERL